MTSFNSVLRHLRQQQAMSQYALGVAIGLPASTAQSTISRWETGASKHGPSPEQLSLLATAFGVDVSVFFAAAA